MPSTALDDKRLEKSWHENKFSGDLDDEGDEWGMRWRGMDQWRHRLYLNSIRDILQDDDTHDVLDIGCALCDFTGKAYKLNPANQFFAMDIVEKAIEWSRPKFPQFRFAAGGLPNIPFATHKFSVIMCLQVLCYLSAEGREKAITNFHSRLIGGGHLLCAASLDGGKQHHTEEELTTLLAQNFEIESVVYHHWFVYRHYVEAPLNKIRFFAQSFRLRLDLPAPQFHKWLNEKSKAKQNLIKFLRVIKPISSSLLGVLSALCKFLLSLKFIAAGLHHLTQFRGHAKADELIILAKKK